MGDGLRIAARPQLRGALRLASGEFGFPDRAGVVQQGMRAGYGAATRGTGEIAAMFMRGSLGVRD